jgi:hypothetical protein
MFENVINEEAIDALPESTLEELLAIFEKAGY